MTMEVVDVYITLLQPMKSHNAPDASVENGVADDIGG